MAVPKRKVSKARRDKRRSAVWKLDAPAYDAYLVAEHDMIDLNETAISDLLLMLPTKLLCREDCKGLCDICGCDWNTSTCDCLK